MPGGGLGLWTAKRFKPNEKIGEYKGEKLTKGQVTQRYGTRTGQYVYCPSSNKCIDARKTSSSVVRYANDKRGTALKNNARLRGQYLKAGPQGIPANREVLASYGAAYWRKS